MRCAGCRRAVTACSTPHSSRPPTWLFDAIPDAYAVAKSIGAVTMSLAAVPAFLIARRVGPPVAGAARRGAQCGDPVDGLHGHDYDGKPLLPGCAHRRLAVVAVPGAAGLGTAAGAARRTRHRVRYARAVARVPAGGGDGAALARARTAQRRVLRPFVPLYAVLAGGAVLVAVAQALAWALSGRPARRVQHRRRRWLRPRLRGALLALARRGAQPLRGRSCLWRRSSCSSSSPRACPSGSRSTWWRRWRSSAGARSRWRCSRRGSRPTGSRTATCSSSCRCSSWPSSAGSRSALRVRAWRRRSP